MGLFFFRWGVPAEGSAHLPLGALLVGGVHEDASVGDGAVDV